MNYKVITVLKSVDTEGQIPAYTLDQYVRNELSHQLLKAIQPDLLIERSAPHRSTVAFTAELTVLQPDQWSLVKEVLNKSIDTLAPDQQAALRLVLNEEGTS